MPLFSSHAYGKPPNRFLRDMFSNLFSGRMGGENFHVFFAGKAVAEEEQHQGACRSFSWRQLQLAADETHGLDCILMHATIFDSTASDETGTFS